MIHDLILKLKNDLADVTINPVLDAFDLNECKKLEQKYSTDLFIKEKIDKCASYLKDITIDFNQNYRSAYEEYNEAVVYADILNRFQLKRVTETSTSTPDFIVTENGEFPFSIYIEVKSLSFLDGNLNYKEAQKNALEMNISIEEQLKDSKQFAFGEAIISPFLKNYKLPSTRDLIEIYINKINNNIKIEQFLLGDTILLIDIKQLLLGSLWDESGISFYQEGLMKSIVSGVLWHTAFGKAGDMIYKPIEFEGMPNTDSPLTKNGILIDHSNIKGLVFATYENFEEKKYLGFIRNKEQDGQSATFISKFCDLHNDEMNSNAWRVLKK